MKGVVLAGGYGTRLFPLTKVTNKHLLPVYNKPMIYYPIELLIKAGIKEIVVVSGGEHIGDFMKLLGSGAEMGVHFNYAVQDGAAGIPIAIHLAKPFIGNEKFVVVLGDNVTVGDISKHVTEFEKGPKGAKIFLKKVTNPQAFGVVEIKDGKIISMEEKPKQPKSDTIMIGIYMLDHKAWELIPKLKPSARGELEIPELMTLYHQNDDLDYAHFDGYWIDAGSGFSNLYEATKYLYDHNKK